MLRILLIEISFCADRGEHPGVGEAGAAVRQPGGPRLRLQHGRRPLGAGGQCQQEGAGEVETRGKESPAAVGPGSGTELWGKDVLRFHKHLCTTFIFVGSKP